jgi:hypothetical protein
MYEANSILVANTNDTPEALIIGASTIVGRDSTGDITALTGSEAKTLLALTKSDVGLGNADDTADTAKPVSTAQQTALDAKVSNSLYDANSILKADMDDTPSALVVSSSSIVGRLAAGGIGALTTAEVLTLLGRTDEDVQDLVGAMVTGNTESGISVTYDDSGGKLDFSVAGGGSGLGGYQGNGSDGAVTLDGVATFSWATLSGSTYTLSRDLWASTLIVNSGVTLHYGGFGIQASISILNNGTISGNGGNATAAVATNNGAGVNLATGSIPGCANGGTFTTGVGNAGASTATAQGGNGGAGGASGTGNAGGAGGTVVGPVVGNGRWKVLQALTSGVIMRGSSTLVAAAGGGGGGSGGGDGTNRSPAGGGGGGWLCVTTPTLINNGVISANGGNGNSQTTAGNAGGSGGGGGGIAIVNTTSPITGTGTITATGGTGGAGFGSGSAGSNGSNGVVMATVWS